MPALSQQVGLPPRYRVVRHIANGGMATVWAAEDSVLERLVAVKVLAAGYAADPAARRRFTREARAAARVSDHPNVVTIFDIGEMEPSHAQAFIVMEHFAGGTVADRLKSGDPIPVPLALRWLRETASALDAAHANDVVHRDVKPGNLLLDENGRLAVGDFGIASLAGETAVTATGQVLGTAAYLSPEQARGHAATAASDRFSLAVVAYELLCGGRPFPGDTAMEQARARLQREPTAPTGAHGAAFPALRHGLARAPEDRPPTARAFVDELEAALADDAEPTRATTVMAPHRTNGPEWVGSEHPRFARSAAEPARREPPRDPVARPRSPHRNSIILGIVALLCLVAGAGAALISDNGNDGGKGPRGPRATASRSQGQPTGGVERAATPRTEAPTTTETAPAQTTTTPAAGDDGSGAEDGRSSAQLNDAGYAMLPGDPRGAVPLLQQAVDGFRAADDTSSITYAYALYNLGWALDLAGRPADAIPYLQERLKVSNYKRGIVEAELKHAQQAAGNAQGAGAGPAAGGFPGDQ
ncbi:MAG TPA: protein kinase [Baekduia sp.]|uniref:serine/threonine-protein kinase n=1 Tax=Baekduia sp. TaxID=2600305 RepID=UPI002D76DC47|nr:protein kinase [Baekduia sp.]HET6508563.1 protein kinase [Baekduia sp.]